MGTLFENLYSLLAYLNPQNPFQELAFPQSPGPPLLPGWKGGYGQVGGYDPRLYVPQPQEDRTVGGNQTYHWGIPSFKQNLDYGEDRMMISKNNLMNQLLNIFSSQNLRSI